MAILKDGKTWRVQLYYRDWRGELKRKQKRGFKTKSEAKRWHDDFLQQQERNCDINFENFVEIYFNDVENRLRQNTMVTKKYIVDLKITPYFKNKKLNEIRVSDIREWQNMLLKEDYSQTYLKTINNQLSAIFNYAMRYYDLKDNPCRRAGSIGKGRTFEKEFWQQEEFEEFLEAVSDKRDARMGFLMLYWTGMRIGELLALTFEDLDMENQTIRINKSYQRIQGKDLITEPKTPKSNRVIAMPDFLKEALEEYLSVLYGIMPHERIFHYTKSYMEHEMIRGIKASGVKRIRLHDLRHSHASMLVEMGVPPLEIANRLGHEKIETTLNTYSHLYPDKEQKLASMLNERCKGRRAEDECE